MRANLLQGPVHAPEIVLLDRATFGGVGARGRSGPLGWRTCLAAWLGLSAVSWLVVFAAVHPFV